MAAQFLKAPYILPSLEGFEGYTMRLVPEEIVLLLAEMGL